MITIKRILYPVIVFIAVVLILTFCLPYLLLPIIEKKMNAVPNYKTTIQSLTVNIFSGSYNLHRVAIDKTNNKVPVPYFTAEKIHIAVEWKSLLKGAFVAKMIFYNPTINFVTDEDEKREQLNLDKRWSNVVKSLFPLNFNRVVIVDGKVHYRTFNTHSPFDLYLKKVNGDLTNLNNTNKENSNLPSHSSVIAQTMNGAPVRLEAKFNPFASTPTFYLAASLKNMNIVDTNNFLQYYTKLRVKKGTFSLYIELSAKHGKLSGYAKPFFKQLEIQTPKNNNPVKALYTFAAKTAAAVLKNNQTKAVATKITMTGDINDPDTSIFSVLVYLLRNAFIETLLPGIDHEIPAKNIFLPRPAINFNKK